MKVLDPKEKAIQYPISDYVRDIWKYAGKDRKKIVWGTVIRIISDIASLYPAYALATIINEITKKDFNFQHILIITLFWILTITIKNICRFYGAKLVFSTGFSIAFDIEKHMLGVLISKDSAWHENDTTGAKRKRIERGSDGYNNILRSWFSYYISVIIKFIGIPVILLNLDIPIAISVVIFGIIYFSISKYLQKACILSAHNFNVEQDELNGTEFEVISNIKTIRFLNVGESVIKKVSNNLKRMLNAAIVRIIAHNKRPRIMNWFSDLTKICLIFVIILGVIKGKYEVGFIVLFSSYFSEILTNIAELADISQDTIVSRQSISRMYDTIGKDIPEDKGKEEFPKTWDGLHIKNLSFSYGENEALKDINFSVINGQKVGIVGLSGAGKSTLFKLLIRERNDHSGSIFVGDTNIEEIKQEEFYNNVSIVPQDTEVFNFSLKENITIANVDEENNKELLKKSLEVSHVVDFIHKMQNGVETLIGEKGVKLSGGERQRLGIARAIFKQPQILLLDEATSHLDLESEEKIKDSLHKFFKNVTAIVIAHRLTTIKEMDNIIVIEGGEIVEQGNFDQLMKSKTRFHELWQKQQL